MLARLSGLTAVSLISTGCIFLYQSLATHILTVNDFGELSKWLTDLALFGSFFMLGLDLALMYHLRLNQSFEGNASKNIVVYSIVLVLCIVILFMLDRASNINFALVFVMYTLALLNMCSTYFQYKENFKKFGLINLLRSFFILIPILFCFIFEIDMGLNLVVISYLGSVLFCLMICSILYFKVATLNRPVELLNLTYYQYGLKSVLNRSLGLLLYSSTTYCVYYLIGSEAAGLFFVASMISKLNWVIPDAAGNILYPKFIKANSKDEKDRAGKEMYFYSRIVLLLNLVTVIIFYIVGEYLIANIYSPEYEDVFFPTLILLIGNQGMVFFKILSRYFAAKNHWLPMRVGLTLAILVNIFLNYFLIPVYGLLGSAISTCVSFFVCGFTLIYYYKKDMLLFFVSDQWLANYKGKLRGK